MRCLLAQVSRSITYINFISNIFIVRSCLVSQLLRRVITDSQADLELGLVLVASDAKMANLHLLAQLNAGLGVDFKKISWLCSVLSCVPC